jgi:type 1 glutamine amidotransferase
MKTRYVIAAFAISAILWPFASSHCTASAGSPKLNESKVRILIITGGHAFEEPQFFGMFESLPDVEITKATLPDAADLLTPALTDTCDVVVFYDMWAKGFNPEQQKAFVALLEKGIGVVALHHTLAAHQDWSEYQKIIGGKYFTGPRKVDGKEVPGSTFQHDVDMKIGIADADHPITRGMKPFEIHDEAYAGYATDPAAAVLLTTDHPKSNREVAWVKTYGNSRVFYLQLGHDHLAYENASFSKLVARGIRWSAGRVADPKAPAQPLFNGKDLSGWQPEGNAVWEVKDGVLVGRQGADFAPGDLLTEASFDDFELSVTYRVVWPANSGVWYRYQAPQKCFQADILEYKEPFALSGSLYCPGKMFIAINEDASIIDREGWNTIVVRTVGTRQILFLNGTKVADIRDDTSSHGKIGFQVHPGDQFGKMQILVRDVSIREI